MRVPTFQAFSVDFSRFMLWKVTLLRLVCLGLVFHHRAMKSVFKIIMNEPSAPLLQRNNVLETEEQGIKDKAFHSFFPKSPVSSKRSYMYLLHVLD